MKYPLLFIITACFLGTCEAQSLEQPLVQTGAEVLLEHHLAELEGKRIGLLMNPSSRVDGVHMVDTLLALEVNVTALFAAEHGFRGQGGAGELIADGIDQETGLPVHSLYGFNRKPTPEMLDQVDIILFDLPDMGVRFYTYSATMGLVLEAISGTDNELWILDRPNPLGGEYVSGWILRDEFKSFVGVYPVPIAYGLTIGEIANMAVGEGWLQLESELKYRVIKNKGWKREMLWPDTGLNWIPPSPNLPGFEHSFAYPGTVIFEGTNFSEGRGTEDPFLLIGAPGMEYVESDLAKIEAEHHVQLAVASFTPKAIPGKAPSPKYEGERCNGIRIFFEGDYTQTDPIKLGLDLLVYAKTHTPNFRMKPFANNLYGIDLKSIIENNEPIPGWEKEVELFKEKKKKYLLYE